VRRRFPVAAALTLAALVLAVVVAAAERGGPDRRTRLVAATGSLSLTSSPGGAIFSADDIAPGDVTHGTATVSNTGTLWGSLRLSAHDLVDAPGPGGGVLSGRLHVTVRDVTAAPTTVYSGSLAAMPERALGLIGPGQARSYAFAASLPEGGTPASATTGDNAFAGASTSVRYQWSATEAAPPKPGAAPPGSGAAPPRSRDRDTSPPLLRLWVPRRQPLLRRRRVVVRVRCTEACRLDLYAWAKNRRGVKRFTRGVRGRELAAGRRTRLVLRVPWAPRAILSSRRRRALRLSAHARDAAGNRMQVRRRVTFSDARRSPEPTRHRRTRRRR
jgi:hypothetical protein